MAAPRRPQPRALALPPGAPEPARDDDAIALRAVVAALPARERDAIVLRFYLGYSVRETAEVLGVPEGTVKTLTHRAVGRLREQGLVDEEVIDA